MLVRYVNGAFQAKPCEETELSKLIHDFHCKKAEDMLIPELASTVWNFKNTERGQKAVSKVIQDLIESAEAAATITALSNAVKGAMMTSGFGNFLYIFIRFL